MVFCLQRKKQRREKSLAKSTISKSAVNDRPYSKTQKLKTGTPKNGDIIASDDYQSKNATLRKPKSQPLTTMLLKNRIKDSEAKPKQSGSTCNSR